MTTAKGGRPATGSIRWRHNPDPLVKKEVWWGRVQMANGERPFVPLDPDIKAHEEERARACAVETRQWYKDHPHADDTIAETFEGYAKRWLEDRQGRVSSIRDDKGRLKQHLLPLLGHLDVREFDRDDVERFRDVLDKSIARGFTVDAADVRRTFSWKTAAHCWSVLTSMCDEMCNAKRRELRVRKENPCKDVRPPERGVRKAKQYLYPSEFLKFISCEDVPRRWRRAVALAVYTYTRDGELRVLRWDGGDVDLEHGVLSITRAWNRRTKEPGTTKTGETRRFAIEPALLPLLQAMHAEKDGEGGVIKLPSERAMARNLRRWLWKANVRRPELHEGSDTCKQLTWHDLRASGITWMAVRGDDPLKIKQRAGHSTFSTTEIYIREAEAVREGFGEVFPTLPACLIDPIGGLDPVWPGPNLGDESSQKQATSGGVDGTRTRGLRRDRPAL
jgi:hypothetical protein